jgi:MFS family permease
MVQNTTTEIDGRTAWRVVAAGFGALFIAFGIAYSFGVFFVPISQTFGTNNSGTSAVFSITSLIFFSLGGLTGPLSDRWGSRTLITGGGIALSCGLFLMSVSHSLLLSYLCYGLGVGVGVGCIYVPLVSTVSNWFDRQRSLAVGILVSGIGLGTLLVAPLSEALISELGWRSTQKIYAAISLAYFLAASKLVARPLVNSRKEVAAKGRLTSRLFILLYISTLLTSVVLYVPLVHLPVFVQQEGYSAGTGALLVALIGVSSVGGRVILGGLGTGKRLLGLYKAALVISGFSYVCWIIGGGLVSLVAFAMLLGVGYGGFIALLPLTLAMLFGAERLGTALGLQYTAVGLGASVGPFAVGGLRDLWGTYLPALVIVFAVGVLAAIISIPVKQAS